MMGLFQRVEVIAGVARRRRWSVEEKLRIVAESFAGGTPSPIALPGPYAYPRLRTISRFPATAVLTAREKRLLPAHAAFA